MAAYKEMITVEWEEGGYTQVWSLGLTEAAASSDARRNLKGRELLLALVDCGAVPHDGVDAAGNRLPAGQDFRPTGERNGIRYFQDGRFQDPPSGEPALQEFSYTGAKRELMHYQAGKLQDTSSGECAWRRFDPRKRA